MRILLGVIVLIDLLIRLGSFDAFVAGNLLPTDIIRDYHYDSTLWSIHLIWDALWWQISLYILHILAAIALIIGFKTRYSIVLVWFLTASLQGFNPMILNGGDSILRLVLFWSMFLPLGIWRSVDNSVNNGDTKKQKPTKAFSVATVGFITQICLVYIFSYLYKTDPSRHTTFEAVYLALSLDGFRTAIGSLLYSHETAMHILTRLVYLLEGFGWIFLFIPWKHYTFKAGIIGIFIFFHIGLGISMNLGMFPWVMIAAWIAIFPIEHFLQDKKNFLQDNNSHKKAIYTKGLPKHINIILAIILAYIISWNIRTLDFDRHSQWFPYKINNIGLFLKIDQYRTMFSPYPTKEDGWYEVYGYQGEEKILLNDPEIGINYKPTRKSSDMIWNDGPRHYNNEKRHKWYSNMREKSGSYLRKPYMARLCKKYPSLDKVKIDFITEFTDYNYMTKTPKRLQLGTYKC